MARFLSASLALILAAASAPVSASATWCHLMRAPVSHPCCASTAEAPAPMLKAQPCCTSVRLAVERPAAERASKSDGPGAPPALGALWFAESDDPASLAVALRPHLARPGLGIPILLKLCSRLT